MVTREYQPPLHPAAGRDNINVAVSSGCRNHRLSLLPVADAPNIDLPVIIVIAQQPGGSPSGVAATVAAPLERHLGRFPA